MKSFGTVKNLETLKNYLSFISLCSENYKNFCITLGTLSVCYVSVSLF